MKTINILGDIIESEQDRWFMAEVSPAQVIDALKEANGEEVEININSNGGSVTGGLAIANAIKRYPGETTCNVLGIAASMASVIACAGKRCTMGQGSFLMIHNPWAYTAGTAEDLRKDADTLDKQRESLISFYRAYCDKSEDEIKAMMDAETWIPAEQAKEYGFNFETYGGELKAAASLTRRAMGKAPDAAKAMLKFEDHKPESAPADAQAEAVAGQVAEPTTEAAVENAPEAPQEPAEATAEAQAEQTPAKPADNWEARFKGLSTKFNELKAEYAAKVDNLTAENKNLKSQLEANGKDLTEANAKVSELTAKLDEGAKALQKANDDLAETRNSLAAEQDKVKHLESTRDMLTAGVLTPPSIGNTYAEKMKAAKTPEERETLRKQKASGKIK